MLNEALPYRYHWNRPEGASRKGQLCTVTARGTMNSCCVRFEDGYTMVTSRNALRRADREFPKLASSGKTNPAHPAPDNRGDHHD